MKKNESTDVTLKIEPKTVKFRGEEFTIQHNYYVDNETNEIFTTSEIDELNVTQVHNKYRSKYGIPFVEEIIDIREQYGLSAAKMSELLGFGPNGYKNYENGEIPSIPHGRYIQLIKNPKEFKKLIELNKNEFEPQVLEKINQKVTSTLPEKNQMDFFEEIFLFNNLIQDEYNGYKKPSLEKVGYLTCYFAKTLNPFKTKMNKLLFYCDFLHFSRTGFGISGLNYIAITHGPVPNKYGSIYSSLFDKGFIDIKMEVFGDGVEGEKLSCKKQDVELDKFSESEAAVIEEVISSLGGKKTKDVVEISHEEFAWLDNYQDKKLISYEYGFSLKHP